MLVNLIRRLTAATSEPIVDTDARLALGALLVRLAKSDGHYAPEEIARIDRALALRYDLSAADAARLRAECEELEHEAPDTVRFTRVIKQAVPHIDRAGVVEALWSIVLADGKRDANEDALMRLVAPLLGIDDAESNMIRQRVAALLP